MKATSVYDIPFDDGFEFSEDAPEAFSLADYGETEDGDISDTAFSVKKAQGCLTPSPDTTQGETILQIGSPSEKQREFLNAKAKVVGYGGARGGGKSWAIRTKAILMALAHPGIRQLIVRRTYPELINNHVLPLRAALGRLAVYNDKNKRLEFLAASSHSLSYGAHSSINFGYCDSESDLLQYQGQEYDIIYIDEATQLTERQIRVLRACIRGVNPFPKRLYLTCNPGGRGHSYVKRILIDREYHAGENPDDYCFISARVTDNHALMEAQPDYVSQLDSLPENLRRAWRDGDWDACEGAYFSEFSRTLHVIQPFALDASLRRYRAFDYGLDCFACLWFAIDREENVYVYREFTSPDLPISEAAAVCERLTPKDESIYCTYAPPDMWSRSQETGKQKADVFREFGLRGMVKASNDRETGWLCVKELLKPRNNGTPRIRIFENCRELIKCLPLLQTDRINPTDCATEPHEYTHICDALRYFAVSRARPESYSDSLPLPDFSRWSSDMISDYQAAPPHIRERLAREWSR